MTGTSESFRSKLVLLLIDKAILGILVVLVGYWLNASLQREGAGVDYQKAIFDRRVEAYLDILQKAEVATDRLRFYWTLKNEGGRSAQLADLERRFEELIRQRTPGNSFSGGGSGGYTDLGDLGKVLSALREVEVSWRSKNIYFSRPVSDMVNRYIQTVYDDLNRSLAREEGLKSQGVRVGTQSTQFSDDASAWSRAQEAFDKLNTEIRTRLKLDGIILG